MQRTHKNYYVCNVTCFCHADLSAYMISTRVYRLSKHFALRYAVCTWAAVIGAAVTSLSMYCSVFFPITFADIRTIYCIFDEHKSIVCIPIHCIEFIGRDTQRLVSLDVLFSRFQIRAQTRHCHQFTFSCKNKDRQQRIERKNGANQNRSLIMRIIKQIMYRFWWHLCPIYGINIDRCLQSGQTECIDPKIRRTKNGSTNLLKIIVIFILYYFIRCLLKRLLNI